MTNLTAELCRRGYILRSGGARGADLACELGAPDNMKEIFLDELHKNTQFGNGTYNVKFFDNLKHARQIAERFHPAWDRLGNRAKALISRNTYQVLGTDLLTHSEFVICWTPDGAKTTTTKDTGGTGQAIRLANYFDIPVYNLANVSDIQYLLVWLEMDTSY